MSLDGDLQILDASHIPECAKIMAQAFSDSPAYNYIFQENQEYRESALEWIFQRNVQLMIQKCPTVLRGFVNRQGQVLACFLWVPSNTSKLTMWEMIMAGMWQIPFRFGLATLQRLLQLMDSMEAAMSATVSSHNQTNPMPFIHLQRMVVRPDCQGKGIGSRSLLAILQESHNITVHLDTQEKRNVRFYQKLGWEVAEEQDFCQQDANFQFHSWHMVRNVKS